MVILQGFTKFFSTIATNLLILIESPNILNWKSAKDNKVGVVLGTEFGPDYYNRFFFIYLNDEYI